MTPAFPIDTCLLAAVTFVGAIVNSVAGGGTLLTFPVLAAILPPGSDRLVTANATSTIGLWPGAAAAAWAYREERAGQPAWSAWLLVPSIAGAVVGAWLVAALPERLFDDLVPWLILVAAILFSAQPVITRLAAGEAPVRGSDGPPTTWRIGVACVLQFVVAVYGGYFGAGIGILMLAMLASLGLGDIHRLNGVKNVLGMNVNGTAAAIFAVGPALGLNRVSWTHAAVMAVAAATGGLFGSVVARRLPAKIVRRFVAIIGFGLAAYYFAI